MPIFTIGTAELQSRTFFHNNVMSYVHTPFSFFCIVIFQIIRLQLTKRLLNITSSLTVRVFASKKPNKEDLINFLMPYNIVSFMKSKRKVGLFVANCGDYDGFDRLCALKEATIGKNCSYIHRDRP